MTTPVPSSTNTDQFRPATLEDVVGQEEVVAELRVALEAATVRGDLPGPMLFTGPAGTGKTTLSLIVARALGSEMVALIGPTLRSPIRDLYKPLVHAAPRTVFFIDEIHRMYRPAQEFLFPIMEDGTIPDGAMRKLPPLMFIGATTDPERLLTPMLDRFTRILALHPYSAAELTEIVTRAASKLGDVLSEDAAAEIGRQGHGIPRVALKMMLAARDYAYASISEQVRKAARMPDGKVGHDARNPAVTIGLGSVQRVLASSAYEWRLEGRSAGER